MSNIHTAASPRTFRHRGSAAKPARHGDSARLTLAKLLACGLVTAVAPGIAAAAASAVGPQPRHVPAVPRNGRRLLGGVYATPTRVPGFDPGYAGNPPDCTGTPLPRVYNLGRDFINGLSPQLQAITSGEVWRDPCASITAFPTTTALVAPYTFDDPSLDYRPYDPALSVALTSLAPLSPEFRPRARAALKAVSAVANIKFVEVPNGRNTSVILRFRDDASPTEEFIAYSYTDYDVGSVIGVSRTANSNRTSENFERSLRHEILHALGLCHPFEGCSSGNTLPIDAWEDADPSTILSYTSSCWGNYYSVVFGALDLDALRLTYGLPQQTAVASPVLTLDGKFNRTSLLPPQGVTTLRASSLYSVVISLASDSTSISLVGEDAVILAPSARLTAGDLRPSGGGYLIGNVNATELWGSPYDDIIDPAGGNANITLGAGRNVVVVRSNGAKVNVLDFSSFSDRLALVDVGTPKVTPAAKRSGATTGGLTLSFAGGEQVTLVGVASAEFSLASVTFDYDPVPDLSWCARREYMFPLDLGLGSEGAAAPGPGFGPAWAPGPSYGPAVAPGPDAPTPFGYGTRPPPSRQPVGGPTVPLGGIIVVTVSATVAAGIASVIGVYVWRRCRSPAQVG